MTTSPSSIRTQTRAVVRSLLARTAMEIFAEKGFDETTVDEVAVAAGVSRRTLFNYFGTKEDLALSGIAEQGEAIAARLAGRPADEDPWVSLRHALEVLDEIEATPQHRFDMVAMLFGNDSLRAAHAEKQARWTALLAPVVEHRLPASDSTAFEARALVAAALACLNAAITEWVRVEGAVGMLDLYDAAVRAVRGDSSR